MKIQCPKCWSDHVSHIYKIPGMFKHRWKCGSCHHKWWTVTR